LAGRQCPMTNFPLPPQAPPIISRDGVDYAICSPHKAHALHLPDDIFFAEVVAIYPVPGRLSLTIPAFIVNDCRTYPVWVISCHFLPKDLNAVVVSPSVTFLEPIAFTACPFLDAVEFPPSIALHCLRGFSSCQISRFIVPDSVVVIGPDCFCLCPWLHSIGFGPGSHLACISGSIRECRPSRRSTFRRHSNFSQGQSSIARV
jgi:hypothetical protein